MPRIDKDLQPIVREAIDTVSRTKLAALLMDKLEDAGASATKEQAEAWAARLLNGDQSPFFLSDSEDDDVTLALSEQDLKALFKDIEQTVGDATSTAVVTTIQAQAKSLAQTLRRRWPAELAAQDAELSEFRLRLRDRWQKPFDTLRMLITCSREIGQESLARSRRLRRPERRTSATLLVRLHARAVQTASEIMTLLEGGFADGAMARWRTLYEITVVAVLISERGGDLAERYNAHQAVEALEAMREYDLNHAALGYAPLNEQERRTVEQNAARAVATYGPSFATPYGWAAEALGLRRPIFTNLEATVGYRHMRSFYKLSSYNVHAGPRALYFNHGTLKGSDVILAGPSNAGFTDAALRTASSLNAINLLLLDLKSIDGALMGNTLLEMVKDLERDLGRAEKRLMADEAALRRT